MNRTHISFDWALKRLLRNKADYVIVEGFLTSLLERPIKIIGLAESEGNQEDENDKSNRVDILAESENKELMLFEIQYEQQSDYFHRMVYSAAKSVVEYVQKGQPYDKMRKIYSIHIVYFNLGQGEDYVYHGKNSFYGKHNHDLLQLSVSQQKKYECKLPEEIFPEYYILKVNQFDKFAEDSLDEWISYFKTSEIPQSAKAPGLQEAYQRLLYANLSASERRQYDAAMKQQAINESVAITHYEEGLSKGIKQGIKQGMKKGIEKGIKQGVKEGVKLQALETARYLKAMGKLSFKEIADATGLNEEEVEQA